MTSSSSRSAQKAAELYEKVIKRLAEIKEPNPSVTAVAEMAAWRKKNIDWETAARITNKELSSTGAPKDLVTTN